VKYHSTMSEEHGQVSVEQSVEQTVEPGDTPGSAEDGEVVEEEIIEEEEYDEEILEEEIVEEEIVEGEGGQTLDGTNHSTEEIVMSDDEYEQEMQRLQEEGENKGADGAQSDDEFIEEEIFEEEEIEGDGQSVDGEIMMDESDDGEELVDEPADARSADGQSVDEHTDDEHTADEHTADKPSTDEPSADAPSLDPPSVDPSASTGQEESVDPSQTTASSENEATQTSGAVLSQEESATTSGDTISDFADFSNMDTGPDTQFTSESDQATDAVFTEDAMAEPSEADEAADVENQSKAAVQPTPKYEPSMMKRPPPKRSKAGYWLCCIITLALLGLGGFFGYWLTRLEEEDELPTVEEFNDISPAPTQAPTVGSTTEFDPIRGDCNFMDLKNPHVVDQCSCVGEIQIIADDVRLRYETHLEVFIPSLYQEFEEDISSCSVRNQALVWLSSANDADFDIDERQERYGLATVFAGLGGNKWSDRQNWLSMSDVCDWSGVECNESGKVQRLVLAGNNAIGTVRICTPYPPSWPDKTCLTLLLYFFAFVSASR
jgi:hypothetical protein